METLDIIGIKLFVLAALNEHQFIFRYSFVCLHCVVPVSVHYRLCLVTVLTKVVPDRILVRFSVRDCWCTFSWSVCKQKRHFIGCNQSSSFQGYDAIHKSWEDIIKLCYRQMVTQVRISEEMYLLQLFPLFCPCPLDLHSEYKTGVLLPS